MQWINKKDYHLSANQIAVWYVDFKQSIDIDKLYSYLSIAEKLKADQFKFEPVRQQFVITRGSLRYLLAKYLQRVANEIEMDYQEKGKPYLTDSAWQFNVSHCHDAALIALSPNITLGIDIEPLDRKVDIEGVAKQIFTDQEQQYIYQHESPKLAFMQCWTRKEAFIKAHGAGMYSDLKAASITNQYGDIVTASDEQGCQWITRDLPVKNNHQMSISHAQVEPDILLYAAV